jgi:hypothetical protein
LPFNLMEQWQAGDGAHRRLTSAIRERVPRP